MINTAYTGTENTTPLYSILSCDHFGCHIASGNKFFASKNVAKARNLVISVWRSCATGSGVVKYTFALQHIIHALFSYMCNLPFLLHLSGYEALRCGGHFACVRASDISRGRGAAKFTKTRKIPRNSVEILSNTCLYNIFETYFSYWGYLLAINLQIYLGTLSLKRAHNYQA